MPDDPYKAPRDEEPETTAMPYLVFVGSLASVCVLVVGLRSITDMASSKAITTLALFAFLAASGAFKSGRPAQMWYPKPVLSRSLMWLTLVLTSTAAMLHVIGVRPKLDGAPLIAWAPLLLFTTMFCRNSVIRYEMWSTRKVQTVTDRED